jgi:hypothetical protein
MEHSRVNDEMTVFNVTYPVRDGSSVEKESRTLLPHAVRYAIKISPCCIPTACGIVQRHLFLSLPNFHPYGMWKRDRKQPTFYQ